MKKLLVLAALTLAAPLASAQSAAVNALTTASTARTAAANAVLIEQAAVIENLVTIVTATRVELADAKTELLALKAAGAARDAKIAELATAIAAIPASTGVTLQQVRTEIIAARLTLPTP